MHMIEAMVHILNLLIKVELRPVWQCFIKHILGRCIEIEFPKLKKNEKVMTYLKIVIFKKYFLYSIGFFKRKNTKN